jgi:hypothetical protein
MLDLDSTQNKISVKWVQNYIDCGNLVIILQSNFEENEYARCLPTFYMTDLKKMEIVLHTL